jgi:hypothetical protein
MKRTVLATTIAAATFAGTAQGEVLEIQCTWGIEPNTEVATYQFDMEQKTAFEVGLPDDVEVRVIIWNDSFIAWNYLMVNGPYPSIGTYMIDRATLKLQAAWVMLGLPEFSSFDIAECVRPL